MNKLIYSLKRLCLPLAFKITGSIYHKLVLSHITVVTITMLVAGVFMYYSSVNTVEQQSEQYNYKMLQLMSEKVDNYIFQLEQVSFLVYLDEIQDQLNAEPGTVLAKTLWGNHINELFSKWIGYIGFKGFVCGITMIRDGTAYYYMGIGEIDEMFNFLNTPWYTEALNSNGQKVLISTHNLPYRYFPVTKVENFSFSLARKINNVKEKKDLGVILIDVELNEP